MQLKEWKERIWLEEDREAQKEEWSSVAVSDEVAAKYASELVAKERWGIFCQVSSNFFFSSDLGLDWSLSVGLGGVGEDAGAVAGAIEGKRA